MEANRRFDAYSGLSRYSVGKVLSVSGTGLSRRDIHTVSRNDYPQTDVPDNRGAPAGEAEGTENGGKSFDDTLNEHTLNSLMEQMKGTYSVSRATLQDNVDAFNQIRRQSANYLIHLLFGHSSPAGGYMSARASRRSSSFSQLLNQTVAKSDSPTGIVSGKNGEYYSSFYYDEEKNTCLDAKGTAVTTDGHRFTFGIRLTMSPSFTETAQGQIRFNQPVLCDPLIVSLHNNATGVSDQKFYFDIDTDSLENENSMRNSGSGSSPPDKSSRRNRLAAIGVGIKSGFGDFASCGRDSGDMMDETSGILRRIHIQTKDAYGRSQFLPLSEAGVGGIRTGYENTGFPDNSEKHYTSAAVRKMDLLLQSSALPS